MAFYPNDVLVARVRIGPPPLPEVVVNISLVLP
jgi:hypothetical protein